MRRRRGLRAILLGCAALVPHKCTRQRLQPARAEHYLAQRGRISLSRREPCCSACRRAAAALSARAAINRTSGDECKTKPGALYAVRTCARYGVQGDGRLAGCLPSENCVSSSAIKSPAQFDAPWLFSPATRDADKAFEELVKAAEASPDLKIAETDPARRYLRATAPSQISNYKATDVDDVEVLISAEKGLVFHRSASRESVFFFPPQNIYSVPLGDNGSNRGRLEARAKALGWESTNPRPEERSTRRGPTRRLNSGCSQSSHSTTSSRNLGQRHVRVRLGHVAPARQKAGAVDVRPAPARAALAPSTSISSQPRRPRVAAGVSKECTARILNEKRRRAPTCS